MQFQGYGYSINPEGEKFVLSLDEAYKLAEDTGMPVYEFHGIFKRERIESTNCIVIKGTRAVYDRAKFLEQKYGIQYNDRYDYGEICYVRYFFRQKVKLNALNKIIDKFMTIFGIKSGVGISVPYLKNEQGPQTFLSNGTIDALLGKLSGDSGAGIINSVQLSKANQISIHEIVSKLNITDACIDDILNIDTMNGSVFNTVVSYYSSLELAMNFFRDEYQIEFIGQAEAIDKFNKEGVGILSEGDSLFENEGGYYRYADGGEIVRVTDFIIKVHGIFLMLSGERKHTVSLISNTGYESDRIVWENTANKAKLADFVQKYGGFHFYGTNNDVMKIHTIISNANVPVTNTVVGYGWHGDECLFANGVWDNKRKEFTETDYMNSMTLVKANGDSIMVADAMGNKIETRTGNKICLFHTPSKNYERDTFLNILKGFWNDNTGVMCLMVACSILGSGIIGQRKETPMYFFKGITQTGKTTISEFIQMMVGYPLNSPETFDGTPFTAMLLLSSSYNLPVFFSEGRNKARGMESKISMFRSAYDKTNVTRGKVDMSAAQFALTAIPVMEGEEMLKDGATRTRCIQFRPSAKAKIGDAEFIERKKQAYILNYFMHSYFNEADTSKYKEYYDDALSMLKGTASSRIIVNLAHMYASSMIYLPEATDDIANMLTYLLHIQTEDEKENGTTVDIIKSVSAFIEKKEYPIYFRNEGFVLSWSAIQEYAIKTKQELSLSVASYKDHLNALGHIVDFYEVMNSFGEEMLIEGPLFRYENVDKRLLCNTEIYANYKIYKSK